MTSSLARTGHLRKRLYPGVAASAGPEFPTGRLPANISGPGGVLRFQPNQAEFLLGLTF